MTVLRCRNSSPLTKHLLNVLGKPSFGLYIIKKFTSEMPLNMTESYLQKSDKFMNAISKTWLSQIFFRYTKVPAPTKKWQSL